MANPLAALGGRTRSRVHLILRDALALGEVFTRTLGTLATSSRGALRMLFRILRMQIYFTGVQALPIAGLLAALVGAGLGTFILAQPILVGLAQLFVETLIIQQFAPLIAAIVVIARTSSAVSVELGNMIVAREVEMLLGFGISPWRHLALPRLLGIVIGTTALCYLVCAIAVLAFYVVVRENPALSGGAFLFNMSTASGVRVGVLGFAYGIVIALVSLNQGLNLQPRYTEVPKAASRAVVKSIVLCALVDAVFSVLLR